LLKPGEFEITFAQGIRVTRKPIGLVFIANKIGRARLGLAISKKAVPLAARRNRLKRVIRDMFRQIASTLPAVDMVIYIQPGGTPLAAPQCREILLQLWKKVADRCASY